MKSVNKYIKKWYPQVIIKIKKKKVKKEEIVTEIPPITIEKN